ncbi:hypothetical protein [Epilithonimonas sp.]|uniref:hypothetical protein n=1 Tax=Epilithonimonas sp. TaxID=2894511 RepID=UPI00289A0EF9|nr:hypothetical protein [Epilithonimonas sp.]
MQLLTTTDVKEYFLKNKIISVHNRIKEDENKRPYVTVYFEKGNSKDIYFEKKISTNYKAGELIVRFFFNNLLIANHISDNSETVEFIIKESEKESSGIKNIIDLIEENFLSNVENEDTYPYIILPNKIENIEKGYLTDLENLDIPQKPKFTTLNYSDYFFCFLILSFLFSSYYFNLLKSTISYLVFTLGILFFYHFIKGTIKLTIERKRQNTIDFKTFELEKQKIIKENKKRQTLFETLKEENKIQEYKNDLILKILSEHIYDEEYINYNFEIKNGRFEEKFKTLLCLIFEDKIKYNKLFNFMIHNDNYINDCVDLSTSSDDDFYTFNKFEKKWKHIYYIPDFIFKDENICIDIEIDEPYTTDLKPIHCKNDMKELERNLFFKAKNWIIIRFSENQIATSPLSCCLFIAYLINRYTKNSKYISKIIQNYTQEYSLKVEKRWTSVDVTEYIERKYREETIKNSII